MAIVGISEHSAPALNSKLGFEVFWSGGSCEIPIAVPARLQIEMFLRKLGKVCLTFTYFARFKSNLFN